MADPMVPVSWGELFDKQSILAIKHRRLRAPRAIANAASELRALAGPAGGAKRSPALTHLVSALAAVNARLWVIEDRIRAREAAGDFGPAFVALARAVYRENDERGRIKRAINELLESKLVEEKQYTAY